MIGCKPTILVVEDSETMWFIYNDLLGEDYQLRLAKDGRQALREVVRSRPDLIILDWTLDDIRAWEQEVHKQESSAPIDARTQKQISGLDVLRTIKRSPLKTIPIIMLTGHNGFHEKLIGKLLRADRYITKPLDEAAFLKAVHSYVPPTPAVHWASTQQVARQEAGA